MNVTWDTVWSAAAALAAAAEDWQESIAALIGFGGVILTLRANAAAQRAAQKDREEETKGSLIAAIKAEFTALASSLEENIRRAGDNPDQHGSMLVPKEPVRSFVFGAPNTNLGILGPEITGAVVGARLSYEELHRGYALIGALTAAGTHLSVSMANARLFIGMTESTVTSLRAALEALEGAS